MFSTQAREIVSQANRIQNLETAKTKFDTQSSFYENNGQEIESLKNRLAVLEGQDLMTKITENSDSTQNLKLDVTKLQSEDTLIKNEILDIEQNQRNASQIFQNYNTELKNFKADQERSMESYKAYNNQTLVSERHEMSRLLDRVYANVSEFELLFKKQDDYLVD